MADDIFTLDENNNAAVRTVSVNAGEAETNSPVIFTTDENGNACVRVVGSGGGIDEDRVIIKSAEIPVASEDELGKFYCYSGTTDANYTHGYIYECVAGSVYYEANIAFAGSVFASEDFYKAGQLIVDAGVVDPTQVTGGTMTYALAGNLWSIVFTDENGNALNTAYSIYTDDLEQDYDILPTIDPSEFTDGQVVNMSINNIVAHTDYSWERLDVQPAAKLGRYLAGWNCATGLAMTNPPESPYEYTTGDYFIVGVVATGGASNYKPDGSSYTTGVASTTVETSVVNVNDTYLYDGTNWTLLKTGSAVTSINGQVGDVNIKSVNGNSLIGSGDLELSTYLTYPNGWTTTGTTKAFCDDIAADTSAVAGKAYLGEVTLSDLPASMANGEIVVEIMSGTTASNKVIKLTCSSGNTAPYMWVYTYWNNGTDVSGWKTLGDTLPSQSGNSGKFLTTDGTDTSWSDKPLVNKSTQSTSYCITDSANGQNATYSVIMGRSIGYTAGSANIIIGQNAENQGNYNVHIGYRSTSGYGCTNNVFIGAESNTLVISAKGCIAIGASSTILQGGGNEGIYVIGHGARSNESYTLSVGWYYNNQYITYKLFDVTGQIPADRWIGTDSSAPSADGTYTPALTISSGVATRSWAPAASAPVVPSTMPTLLAASWSSNTQTVSVTGVTASNVVFVSPAPASAADYAAANVLCVSQSTNSLTFQCDTVPTNDITVNICILN